MKRTYTTLGGKKKKKAKVQKNTLLNNFLTGVNTAKKILDAKQIDREAATKRGKFGSGPGAAAMALLDNPQVKGVTYKTSCGVVE